MYNYMIAQPDKLFWIAVLFVIGFIFELCVIYIMYRKTNKTLAIIEMEKQFLRTVLKDKEMCESYRNFNKAMEEYNMIQKVIKNDR